MWWLWACQTGELAEPPRPAVPVVAPAPPARPEPWSLVGRAVAKGTASPPLHETPSWPEVCQRPYTPVCFVEVWARGAERTRVERKGAELLVDGAAEAGAWPNLGKALLACTGDPFGFPLPGGQRVLTDEAWVLDFSGDNVCHLRGALRLPRHGTRAEWSGLEVDGLPWSHGGLERARRLSRTAR